MLTPTGTYFSAREVWLLLNSACVVQSRVYHTWLSSTFIMCGSVPHLSCVPQSYVAFSALGEVSLVLELIFDFYVCSVFCFFKKYNVVGFE